MHQHASLAAAGAGQNQQIASLSTDRFSLGLVETIQDMGDVHPGILLTLIRDKQRSSCLITKGYCRTNAMADS